MNDYLVQERLGQMTDIADRLFQVDTESVYETPEMRQRLYQLAVQVHSDQLPFTVHDDTEMERIAGQHGYTEIGDEELVGFGARTTHPDGSVQYEIHLSSRLPETLRPTVLGHEAAEAYVRNDYDDPLDEVYMEIARLRETARVALNDGGEVGKRAAADVIGGLALVGYGKDFLSRSVRAVATKNEREFLTMYDTYGLTGGARKLKDDGDMEWFTGKALGAMFYAPKMLESGARSAWNDLSKNWFGGYFEVKPGNGFFDDVEEGIGRLFGAVYEAAENAGKAEKPAEKPKPPEPKKPEPKKEEKKP